MSTGVEKIFIAIFSTPKYLLNPLSRKDLYSFRFGLSSRVQSFVDFKSVDENRRDKCSFLTFARLKALSRFQGCCTGNKRLELANRRSLSTAAKSSRGHNQLNEGSLCQPLPNPSSATNENSRQHPARSMVYNTDATIFISAAPSPVSTSIHVDSR